MGQAGDGGARRRLPRLALLGVLVALLLLGGAGAASAHAGLRSADPADGTVLASAPRALTLTFTESVGLLDDSFRLFAPDGRRVRTGEPRHAPGRTDTAQVAFPAGLGQGTFTVAWRVVSADSHPVSGAFTFSVGRPSPATAAVDTGPAEDPLTGGLYDLARYAAYGAAALLVGTAAFALLCRPPDPGPLRRPLAAGWWLLLAATLALLVLRAPYESGADPAAAFTPSALSRTLAGRPGVVLLIRLTLLAPTALFLARMFLVRLCRVRLCRRGPQPDAPGEGRTAPQREDRTPAPSRAALATGAVLALALALTWAASDHASAGLQVPAAMASSVLHLLAMAVWLGGLTALLTTLQRTPRTTTAADTDDSAGTAPAALITPLAATAARFSRLAFLAVTVLVATGVYQSWRGLGSWPALTGTAYGRLLLVKLFAVVLLLAVAAASRHWTARLASARTGLRALRRSVLAEVAVGVAVLMVSTVLSGTLPGRAATEAAEAAPVAAGVPGASVTEIPFDTGSPGGRGTVQITLEPGRVGQNAVEAVVFGPDGGLSTVPELRLSLSLPDRDIGPIDARLVNRGGYWGTDSLNLPFPGAWSAKATVRVSDLDQGSGSRTVRIAR
ncbi:copper resistance protein CopC [Streptomyces sp. Amel2xE9]|uniref:copper resistance CopC/CopD family protein n=1 Tax=unclassified Streptomyces TaxID=2593676 RepID=UPI00036EA87A|nr:copper resistance protein CopC [Streptomyces sp. Amel2xE9]